MIGHRTFGSSKHCGTILASTASVVLQDVAQRGDVPALLPLPWASSPSPKTSPTVVCAMRSPRRSTPSNGGAWDAWRAEAKSEPGMPHHGSAVPESEEGPGPQAGALDGIWRDGGTPGSATNREERQALEEETREVGHVRWSVYCAYLRATGWGMVAVVFISLLLMQARLQCPPNSSIVSLFPR